MGKCAAGAPSLQSGHNQSAISSSDRRPRPGSCTTVTLSYDRVEKSERADKELLPPCTSLKLLLESYCVSRTVWLAGRYVRSRSRERRPLWRFQQARKQCKRRRPVWYCCTFDLR